MMTMLNLSNHDIKMCFCLTGDPHDDGQDHLRRACGRPQADVDEAHGARRHHLRVCERVRFVFACAQVCVCMRLCVCVFMCVRVCETPTTSPSATASSPEARGCSSPAPASCRPTAAAIFNLKKDAGYRGGVGLFQSSARIVSADSSCDSV